MGASHEFLIFTVLQYLYFKNGHIIYFGWNRIAQLSANRILRAKRVERVASYKSRKRHIFLKFKLETIN